MTRLQTLNRKMLARWRAGTIDDAEYDTYKALLDAVEMVRYALDVFEGACVCGECGPCRTEVKMRNLLESLK